MTEKQLEQVKSQLPEGETFARAYQAFEGDIRVISQDKQGCEYRYRVTFNPDDSVTIQRF